MQMKSYDTPKKLCAAVKRYFEGISRMEEVTETATTGELDRYGHPVTEPRTVFNGKGRPVMRRRFALPPSIQGLVLELGLDMAEWKRLTSQEGWQTAAQAADGICEAWLVEQLLTRNKGVEGIKFALTHNYGWSEKQSLSLEGDSVERYLESLEAEEEF